MTGPGAALPFVNWLFWSTLASGTLGVVAATELLGGTTRGYRLFMAAFVVASAAVLLLSELSLSTGGSARTVLVVAFAAGCAGYAAFSIVQLSWRGWLGLAVSGLGVAATVSLALATGGTSTELFVAQLTIATLALGSVTAAMLLGHWYLVTPRLSPLPLRRMMWLLLASLVVQGALFGLAAILVPGDALTGSLAWLAWLRLGAGTLLPAGVTVLAILASRAASLQASTGLLYIGLALIAAGAIGGTSITYLTGVPL